MKIKDHNDDCRSHVGGWHPHWYFGCWLSNHFGKVWRSNNKELRKITFSPRCSSPRWAETHRPATRSKLPSLIYSIATNRHSPPARCLLARGKAEGEEEEGGEKVPGVFVRCSKNTIFSRAGKEANSKRCKRRPSAMAARTHMHTHFLRLHENNEEWGGRLLYKVPTSYV